MNEPTPAMASSTPSYPPRLSWPPPGLESMHGELWMVIGEFSVGVIILAAPLLLAIATDPGFWGLGPFGQSWWIPLATSLIALVVLGISSQRSSRLLRGAATALELGYGVGTIATVATDLSKDSGFVLQGARVFATMTAQERASLLMLRIVRALCYLGAALWVPIGLAVAVFLGATESITTHGVWIITLAPAAMLLLIAVASGLGEGLALRKVRRANAGVVEREMHNEARQWTENLLVVAEGTAIAPRRMLKPRTLKLTAIAVVIPAILLIGPVGAVLTSAAMGPLLADIALPRFGKTQAKLATADAMRIYRLPSNPAITPGQAGAAVINLAYAGKPLDHDALSKPPAVHYDAWPAGPKDWDLAGEAASGALFTKVRSGLTPVQRAYLMAVAAHPSHREFQTVAYAARTDINGAHYVMPLPDTLSAGLLPILRFSGLREAAHFHLAKAAVEFSEGRNAEAERTIKETISLGFVLLDDGTFLIENLIGNIIVGSGAKALEQFYRMSGRVAEADALVARRAGAERAATLATAINPEQSTLDLLSTMPGIVSNHDAMRGLRWETFVTFSSFAACLNLHNVVFGPGADYDAWVETTRTSLVRSPADAELFAVVKGGFMGSKGRPTTRCLPTGKLIRMLKEGTLF